MLLMGYIQELYVLLHCRSDMKKYFLTFTVLFFVSCNAVQAQQFETSLAPSDYEVVAQPGSTMNLSYTFTNTGDPAVFKLKTYLVVPDPQTGESSLLPYSSENLPDFPQFAVESRDVFLDSPILLSSQEAIEFVIRLTIPEALPENEYTFALVGESEPVEGFEDQNRILLQGGVGSLIHLIVTREASFERTGSVTLFDIAGGFEFQLGETQIHISDSRNNVPIILRARSAGTLSVPVAGQIIITPQWGATFTLPLHKQRILAGSEKLILGDITHDTDASTEFAPSIINVYRLESYIQFDTAAPSDAQKLYLIVLPLQTLGIFGIAGVLIFLVFLLLRYVKKKGLG